MLYEKVGLKQAVADCYSKAALLALILCTGLSHNMSTYSYNIYNYECCTFHWLLNFLLFLGGGGYGFLT